MIKIDLQNHKFNFTENNVENEHKEKNIYKLKNRDCYLFTSFPNYIMYISLLVTQIEIFWETIYFLHLYIYVKS